MAQKTTIEWTDRTWNPVRGCSRISEGCRHCYAEGIAARFSGPGQPYEGLAHFVGKHPDREARWTGQVRLVEAALGAPLKWRKPARIFVNSTSDLFHESLSDRDIDRVFAVMALAQRHTMQVLTKRPHRMRQYMANFSWERVVDNCRDPNGVSVIPRHSAHHLMRAFGLAPRFSYDKDCSAFPLPNLWLGVSVEHQDAAEERVPDLLATPAAVRFLSCEPLLGQVILTHINLDKAEAREREPSGLVMLDSLTGMHFDGEGSIPGVLASPDHKIDWVIAGGESGPNSRPMHLVWVRGLRDQCVSANVPFFFKQHGEWLHIPSIHRAGGSSFYEFDDHTYAQRMGKKASGRHLDGRTWDEFPVEPST